MSSTLPTFTANPLSPPLEGAASGLALAVEAPEPRRRIVHGSYRVTTADRAVLGRDPVRHQVWLLAIERATLVRRAGRPGAGVVVFAGEEPAGAAIEGHFSVDLHECVALEARSAGVYHVIAVLGPFKSPAVEVSIGM